ncbi:MAG: hypothetical protein KGI48_05345 [Hyphomicrobiales bacterium]|nr:hypothetical protein [Hyphomicrobiales bacterium]
MQALRTIFSPSGRLSPQIFIVLIGLVYVAGAVSHALTVPDVIIRAGLWPFIAAQALLIWIWYVLHAKRLRDGGRAAGLAVAAAVLYTLAVALMIIVAVSFYGALSAQVPDANTASAFGLLLLVSIIAILLGAPHYDAAWLMVVVLLLLAFVPIIVAVAVTLWAATRPSVRQPAG